MQIIKRYSSQITHINADESNLKGAIPARSRRQMQENGTLEKYNATDVTHFTNNMNDTWQKMHRQEPEEFQLSQNVTVICNAPCKIQVLLSTSRPSAFFPKHTGERE